MECFVLAEDVRDAVIEEGAETKANGRMIARFCEKVRESLFSHEG